jgi:RNA-directed DNA polymerase
LQYLRQERNGGATRDGDAVARPWARKFLGYSFTWHKQARLEIADSSLKRLKDKVRDIVVGNASRNLVATIHELNPVLHGWKSASNGRGPWWNAGASNMNAAYPKCARVGFAAGYPAALPAC